MKYRWHKILFYLVIVVAAVFAMDTVSAYNTDIFTQAVSRLGYQFAYPNLYSNPTRDASRTMDTDSETDTRTVYLTFDDGPSARTEEILDILEQYNIKATFFVVNNDSEKAKQTISRAYSEGHSIGVHSASHSYKEIYRSVDSFLQDFESCFSYITEITGDTPTIFRFPGGSVNSFNKAVCHDIAQEMYRRGFVYFDWNVSSDDATRSYSEDSIYRKVMDGCRNRDESVVLMHDSATKKETVAALKRIIPDLLEQGFVFDRLDENARPTIFKME